ncbi:MAG: DUF2147 domain-containing protein, partial [Bacteroidetes bacterium]|nr:DUF2147 domain-containing protein [Bacteroidota bacterium]
MKRQLHLSLGSLLLVYLLFFIVPVTHASDDEERVALESQYLGVWMGDNGEERFEIYKKGDKYYGKIIWTAYDDLNGNGLLDSKNPDPTKRNRSIIGLDILLDFELNKNGTLS